VNSLPIKKLEPPKKPDFEKSLVRLEEVVRRLESPQLSLDDAMKLIQETHKMNPPLAAQYRDQLSEIEADITKRLNQRGGNPNPTAEPINTASGQ